VEAFALAFGVILLAELGDKSQLIAIAFTARYPVPVVLAGISAATMLITAASVVLGLAFAAALPLNVLQLVGGVLFLVFAVLTAWRSEADPKEEVRTPARTRWAVATVAAAYVVAELGDKTQLATIALAATNNAFLVWLGASAAMISANAVAITLAALVGSRLPERALRLLAALGFLVFGVLLLLEASGLLGS
jgi:putative Ca2+/H+ antiporter (TMEM165/GDT1 family)